MFSTNNETEILKRRVAQLEAANANALQELRTTLTAVQANDRSKAIHAIEAAQNTLHRA